ncbi:hypothetical protein [Lacimicrobium alkaliphilum]|uniref:Uncharacterized protein n=1 Tax=Lacimicrobium alkaliphilum TaxID=1526571 RepID=A0ABQ1RRY0_9ALTE|nr:hypothetical protein [Lacimicrobium alkaliphilum]GGD79556.1 hypothetical protein GCM10011357_38150 [Lacimicrobium alkaliphilum]
MKNLLMNTTVAIAFFIFGYIFYPMINEVNVETELMGGENKVREDFTIVESENLVGPVKANQGDLNDVEVSGGSEKETVELDGYNGREAVDFDEEETVEDKELVSFQNELKEWAAVHKARVSDLITAYMSSGSAEHMKLQIMDGNEFLTQPPIEQDVVEDESWAYNMEELLDILISKHELSDKFQLLNLSCKQLMCDILGVEKEAGVWFKLYVSLLQNAPGIEFPDGNNDPKSVAYMENDVAVIYSQLKFKGR